MGTAPDLLPDVVREFVGAAHGDFPKVKALSATTPALVTARYAEWNETAIEAASHMGRRDIVEYLLATGAPLDIFTAAMMGMRDRVIAFLDTDSEIGRDADSASGRATGVHGIPLMAFAGLSGDVEMAELVAARGGHADVDAALHGAVRLGHVAMVRWLLERGANANIPNFDRKTPLRVALDTRQDPIAELLREYGGTE